MNTKALKFCPSCRQRKPVGEFYRRRNGGRASYCKPCTQLAARAAQQRRRQDSVQAARLRAVDRARQRRRRSLLAQVVDQRGGDAA